MTLQPAFSSSLTAAKPTLGRMRSTRQVTNRPTRLPAPGNRFSTSVKIGSPAATARTLDQRRPRFKATAKIAARARGRSVESIGLAALLDCGDGEARGFSGFLTFQGFARRKIFLGPRRPPNSPPAMRAAAAGRGAAASLPLPTGRWRTRRPRGFFVFLFLKGFGRRKFFRPPRRPQGSPPPMAEAARRGGAAPTRPG